jgi:hypothetical protein
MERAKLDGPSLREVTALVGTILVMVLSFIGVVVLCSSAHSQTTNAMTVRAAPAASTTGDLGAPTDLASAGVEASGLR